MTECVFIDGAGFNSRCRFTHHPSGKTILRQPYMNPVQWIDCQLAYFESYLELNIFDGERNYNPENDVLSSVKDYVETLKTNREESVRIFGES